MTEDVWIRVFVVEEDDRAWVKVAIGEAWARGDAKNAHGLAEDLLVAAADLEHREARRRLVLVKGESKQR